MLVSRSYLIEQKQDDQLAITADKLTNKIYRTKKIKVGKVDLVRIGIDEVLKRQDLQNQLINDKNGQL